MKRAIRGYLLKDSNTVVTEIGFINNTKVEDFKEVTVVVSSDEIKQWNHEIEVLEQEEE